MYPGYETFNVHVDLKVTIHGVKGGNGPPMLLLHGFPQTNAIWHKVAPSLSSKFTLIIPDLRGYGNSSKPTNEDDPTDHKLYAKSSMAADMSAVMSELGYSSYFVVGHDRGGRLSHKLCIDYPAEVKKCMILDICPTLAMYGSTNQLLATAYWHWFFLIQPTPFPEEVICSNPEAFGKKMLLGLPKGGKSEGVEVFPKDVYSEYMRHLSDRDTVHTMCEDYRASSTNDMEEQRADIKAGRKIKCPLRILWGKYGLIEKEFDAIKEWSNVAEDGLVDKRSEAVDCGHYIPEEAPDDLVEHILEFFSD